MPGRAGGLGSPRQVVVRYRILVGILAKHSDAENVDSTALIPAASGSPSVRPGRVCRAAQRYDYSEWGAVTMVGSIRRVRVALAFLALIVPSSVSLPAVLAGDDQSKSAKPSEPPKDQKRGAASSQPGQVADSRAQVLDTFTQLGDDTPKPFVPLRPATVEDRRRTEVLRLFGAVRALEDRRRWSDAAALLQEALKIDPDSVAIARRLSRIYVGALGRPDLAVQYSKRVLAAEPSDSDTLIRLVDFYNQRNDSAGALALVQEVLANPKLDAHVPDV